MAERKNRSIMEVVKAMIHDLDLPMYMLAEATITTIYVHNRISHRSLGSKTPEEMFSRENPKVSHLNIFDCHVYIHIPKEKISKFDPSGNKGFIVGYSEQSKYYRIYIPGYRQIEISRDVTFDEETNFRKSRKDMEVKEEHENPRPAEASKPVRNEEDQIPKDHDMTQPHRPEELFSEMISHKIRHAWECKVIEEE